MPDSSNFTTVPLANFLELLSPQESVPLLTLVPEEIMRKTYKNIKGLCFLTSVFCWTSAQAGLRMEGDTSHSEDLRAEDINLEEFAGSYPTLSPETQNELEALDQAESLFMGNIQEETKSAAGGIFSQLLDGAPGGRFLTVGHNPDLYIQYFMASPALKNVQFLMATLRGELKIVSVISTGALMKSKRVIRGIPGWTPDSSFENPRPITAMHPDAESAKYPGRDRRYGYGNMDFFMDITGEGKAGFHATLLPSYPFLGIPASHGCIRQGRGQAENLFGLVIANGKSANVVQHPVGKDPVGVDLVALEYFVKQDLAHIKNLARKGQYGKPSEVPAVPQGIPVAIPLNNLVNRDTLPGQI